MHDIGDAASIGISYLLEKKSSRPPDKTYTYGYARCSVLGSVITVAILLFGSLTVIYNAVGRIINPTEINFRGMIVFALIGACVNFCAAIFTRGGESLNQKAVNLHMLEDVLGWIAVLIGAVVMRFTGFVRIDPLLSIAVALFILVNAVRHLKAALDLFLEKVPQGLDADEIRAHIAGIEGVIDVHHIHIRSLDGHRHCATMHIVTDADAQAIKAAVRAQLRAHGIGHATLELEAENEPCAAPQCCVETAAACSHHYHHHH